MQTAVIIPAAGSSTRFQQSSAKPPSASKIEQDLEGKPVFLRSIELFLKRTNVGPIILGVNPDEVEEFKFRWGDKIAFHGVTIVAGGRTERWETVANALQHVPDDATHVAVHDAARPLASGKLIDRVLEAAEKFAAVIPGLAVSNTLKRVRDVPPPPQDADPLDAILGSAGKAPIRVKQVVQTVDRGGLVEVQTPQVFEVGLLRRAYAQIASGTVKPESITDDAALVESLGQPVHVVEGEATNFKITRAEDLALAAAYVAATQQKESAVLARKRLFADEEE